MMNTNKEVRAEYLQTPLPGELVVAGAALASIWIVMSLALWFAAA